MSDGYCESCAADEMWESQGIPAVWASPTHTCGLEGALNVIDRTLDSMETIRIEWTAEEVEDMLKDIRARLVPNRTVGPESFADRMARQSIEAMEAQKAADRTTCDHGAYYVNEDGARVCLVCGHVTDRTIRHEEDR